MNTSTNIANEERLIQVSTGQVTLEGNLRYPRGAFGVVLFAHGSGSSRHSPRNRFVAQALSEAGLATLLIDLLTIREEAIDESTGHLRFDIEFLAERLSGATDWLTQQTETRNLPIGYFGASTGAAAALLAAARRPDYVSAIVSRGGRPDLAGDALPDVQAPALLIVGGNDGPVVGLNRSAFDRLGSARKELAVIPGTTHLFEEPGALEEVARLATNWFLQHLKADTMTNGA